MYEKVAEENMAQKNTKIIWNISKVAEYVWMELLVKNLFKVYNITWKVAEGKLFILSNSRLNDGLNLHEIK